MELAGTEGLKTPGASSSHHPDPLNRHSTQAHWPVAVTGPGKSGFHILRFSTAPKGSGSSWVWDPPGPWGADTTQVTRGALGPVTLYGEGSESTEARGGDALSPRGRAASGPLPTLLQPDPFRIMHVCSWGSAFAREIGKCL